GFDGINKADIKLKGMNKDKVGESLLYTNNFLLLLGYDNAYYICIKKDQRYCKVDTKRKLPSIPDFTTINRRIIKSNSPTNTDKELSQDEFIIIVINSTEIKVNNRGQ
ncbi:MAG TPA: hypothetical protein VN704_02170, partial [Verrucomicrobiae bacterium]|nr:hypothetical protein [Verrucomicrobiae bacterium]